MRYQGRRIEKNPYFSSYLKIIPVIDDRALVTLSFFFCIFIPESIRASSRAWSSNETGLELTKAARPSKQKKIDRFIFQLRSNLATSSNPSQAIRF